MDEINYNNINYLINLLYDHIYDNNSSRCTKYDKITKKDINLLNIKKSNTFDYTDLVFNDEIKFIGKFVYKCFYKKYLPSKYSATIRIGTYNKNNDDIDDLTRPENVDKVMMYLLSYLVLSKKTQHILLPVLNFDLPINEIKKNDKIYPHIEKCSNLVDNNKIHNTLSVQVTEHFFKSKFLHPFIESTNFQLIHWKQLFFQILYTLAQIQDLYPSFRHNNLTTNTIELYIKKESDKTKIYNIKNTNFNVPSSDFDIKFAHFNRSCINNLVENKFVDRHNNLSNKENKYFDVHYFFNTLIGFKSDKYIKNLMDLKEITDFLDRILPEQLRSSSNKLNDFYLNTELYNNMSNTDKKKLEPLYILLNDPLFNDFKEIYDSPTVSTISSYHDNKQFNIPNYIENSLSENSLSDNNLSDNNLSENSLSENSLSSISFSENVSDNYLKYNIEENNLLNNSIVEGMPKNKKKVNKINKNINPVNVYNSKLSSTNKLANYFNESEKNLQNKGYNIFASGKKQEYNYPSNLMNANQMASQVNNNSYQQQNNLINEQQLPSQVNNSYQEPNNLQLNDIETVQRKSNSDIYNPLMNNATEIFQNNSHMMQTPMMKQPIMQQPMMQQPMMQQPIMQQPMMQQPMMQQPMMQQPMMQQPMMQQPMMQQPMMQQYMGQMGGSPYVELDNAVNKQTGGSPYVELDNAVNNGQTGGSPYVELDNAVNNGQNGGSDFFFLTKN
jgi:hypothetical protein